MITGMLWRGSPQAQEVIDDADFWGIPAELMADANDSQDGLLREHLPAVEAFLAIRGQWRVLPQYGSAPLFLGLDYSAAEAGLRLAGIAASPDLWAQIRLIEAGAIEALNGC